MEDCTDILKVLVSIRQVINMFILSVNLYRSVESK
jgi:hypothetical protein